jgi:hypothetical protein
MSTVHPDHKRQIHIFLDLEKAYDRVPIPLLLDKLLLRQTPMPLIQLIDSLFSRCSSQLIVNQQVGPLFPRSRGLFQGSILSPWLFNVFIDDLAHSLVRIDPHPLIPPCLFFADDIKLQPSSATIAKRTLAITSTWSVRNGININIAKSGVLKNRTTNSLLLSVSSQPLPLVPSYTYLGLPFTPSGIDFTSHLAQVQRQSQILFFASSKQSRAWPPMLRLYMLKIFYRSKYEYALPLIAASGTALTKLQKFQNSLIQWVINGHAGSDIGHSLTGIPPLSQCVQELTMRFQFFLYKLHSDNPVRVLLSHLRSASFYPKIDRTLLAPLSRNNSIYTQFQSFSNTLPPWVPYTLSDHILVSRLDLFNSSPLIMPHTILASARDHNLIDISIRIRSPILRSFVLRWRLNRLASNYHCDCGIRLNRGHLESCYLLHEHPLFQQYAHSFPSPPPTPTYNLLDHAINMQQLRHFRKLMFDITHHHHFDSVT